MINFIPIFPLGIVVYPGESLNLHIFEDRYKQLVNESFKTKKPFGIPSVLNDSVTDFGTLVKVTEIVEVYEDGKLDIRTEGISVFRLLELIKKVPDKLYSGAIVEYPANETQACFLLVVLDSQAGPALQLCLLLLPAALAIQKASLVFPRCWVRLAF